MKAPFILLHRKGLPIYVSFRHIPGRRLSSGCYSDAEAARWAEEQLKNAGLARTDTIPTLASYAAHFFDADDPKGIRARNERRNRHYGDIYYMQQKGRLDNWILPALGPRLVDSLTPVAIEDWFLAIPRADNTRNKILQCLQVVLDEAMRDGIITENPARQVSLINAQYRRRDPFSDEEMERLFPDNIHAIVGVWGSVMWAGYFSVMKDTGFRPGEVAAIRAKNWFPRYSGLYITESVDCYTRELKPSIKTSAKGQPYKIGKVSAMTARLIEILKVQTTDGFLFGVENRQHPGVVRRINPDTANKHLEGVCKRLGIDLHGRTQYSFRHTFDTAMFGRLPEDVRLQLMGHVGDRAEYLHMTPERGFEILEEKLGGS